MTNITSTNETITSNQTISNQTISNQTISNEAISNEIISNETISNENEAISLHMTNGVMAQVQQASCTANQYSSSGACVGCPAGYYSAGGQATQCLESIVDYYYKAFSIMVIGLSYYRIMTHAFTKKKEDSGVDTSDKMKEDTKKKNYGSWWNCYRCCVFGVRSSYSLNSNNYRIYVLCCLGFVFSCADNSICVWVYLIYTKKFTFNK